MTAPRRTWAYGLTANVVILAAVSLLTDVSSEMIVPILPFFIIDILLGNAFIVGLIEGLAEGVVSFVKILSGRWSDLLGRRKAFVAAGYGLSASMKALFPFAAVWPSFLGMRLVERTGKGIRDAPRDALLAESAPREVRGKAFGFHRSMDTTGAIVGPLITLGLLTTVGATMATGDAYRSILLLAAIPAAVAFALVFLAREVRRTPAPRIPLRLSFRGAPRSLLAFVAIATVFSLGEFSYAFLLLRVGGTAIPAAILLYVLFNVVYAAAAWPAGSLSDRIGRKRVILVGYVAFAAMAGLFVGAATLPLFAIGFILYGISYGMTQGTERALVVDLAPPEIRATVLGAYHTSVGLVKIASGVVAGLLWTVVAPEATFLFGALVATAATLGLLLWKPSLTS